MVEARHYFLIPFLAVSPFKVDLEHLFPDVDTDITALPYQRIRESCPDYCGALHGGVPFQYIVCYPPNTRRHHGRGSAGVSGAGDPVVLLGAVSEGVSGDSGPLEGLLWPGCAASGQ